MSTDPKPVATGSGTGGRLTSAEKRRREQASPIVKLMNLLSLTFKQPLRLPTPEQAADMKRLTVEVEKLLEYRAAHPDWRREG